MTNKTRKNNKKELTVNNLQMFIQLTILGLMANPNYSDLGKELLKSYKEMFDIKHI